MIQLPSKIRTTLFNASIEVDPYQLFSHEDDRLLALIYVTGDNQTYPALGRSKQDVLNSDYINSQSYSPITIYGPEPLWIGYSSRTGILALGFVIVHGIYRA